MESWLNIPENSDFPLENIPFGVFSTKINSTPRCGTIIGNSVIDLFALSTLLPEVFTGPLLSNGIASTVFSKPYLNEFMALGRPSWRECRSTLQHLFLSTTTTKLRQDKGLQDKIIFSESEVEMHLPARIGDYTDFYSSREHAENVGTMFRGKDNALMPNWVHIPVGYHGRSSSIVIDKTPIKRPSGMVLDPVTKTPVFSASKKLDFELEMAFLIGVGNKLGEPVDCKDAEDHIFGVVIMNDWSARDIQQFEYVPLGPFLGKNFGTTISPWVVTLDALEMFRVPQPVQVPDPVAYLQNENKPNDAYDINLEVYMKDHETNVKQLISRSNLKYMYWSFNQQVAHHTINGCNLQTGDLCGTGTLSGPKAESYGSLLELTWNGTKPLVIEGTNHSKTFLEDHDEIHMTAFAEKQSTGNTVRVGFGSARGAVVP